ncbi:MAG: DUF5677 domain-containing protein [Chloroflexota bacterium]
MAVLDTGPRLQRLTGHSFLGFVMAGLGRRIHSLAEGLVLIVRANPPRGPEALILARTMWEILVFAEYLAAVPQQREQRAIEYMAHTPPARGDRRRKATPADKRRAEANRAFLAEKLREELERQGASPDRARRKATAEIQRRSGLSDPMPAKIFDMVTSVAKKDRLQEHAVTYPFLCQYSHAGGGSLIDAMRDYEEWVDQEGDSHSALVASLFACGWLLEFYDCVDTVYSFGWHPRIVTMSQLAKSKWDRRGIPRGAADV